MSCFTVPSRNSTPLALKKPPARFYHTPGSPPVPQDLILQVAARSKIPRRRDRAFPQPSCTPGVRTSLPSIHTIPTCVRSLLPAACSSRNHQRWIHYAPLASPAAGPGAPLRLPATSSSLGPGATSTGKRMARLQRPGRRFPGTGKLLCRAAASIEAKEVDRLPAQANPPFGEPPPSCSATLGPLTHASHRHFFFPITALLAFDGERVNLPAGRIMPMAAKQRIMTFFLPPTEFPTPLLPPRCCPEAFVRIPPLFRAMPFSPPLPKPATLPLARTLAGAGPSPSNSTTHARQTPAGQRCTLALPENLRWTHVA